MTVTVTLSKEEYELMEAYAKCRIVSIGELMRKSLLEKILDDYDMAVQLKEALDEYEKTHVSYSFEEVKKMLDI